MRCAAARGFGGTWLDLKLQPIAETIIVVGKVLSKKAGGASLGTTMQQPGRLEATGLLNLQDSWMIPLPTVQTIQVLIPTLPT